MIQDEVMDLVFKLARTTSLKEMVSILLSFPKGDSVRRSDIDLLFEHAIIPFPRRFALRILALGQFRRG